MPEPGTRLDLAVTALGAAGDGIARDAEGRTVFVPRSLPGETWQACVTGRRGEALLALPETLLGAASPERAVPPCPHVGACGGCALQHWQAAPYLAWKRQKLVDALTRAGFPDAPVAQTVATPPGTRRRADLALRRGADGAIRLGFHAAGDPQQVTDLGSCTVLDPRIVALFDPLRGVLKRLGAALRRDGSAVVNLLDTGPDLLLRTDGHLDAAGRILLAAFAAEHAIPRVAWAHGNGLPETAAQRGPVEIRLAGTAVAPPPGAFLQASPAGEAALQAAVLAALPKRLPPRAQVAELYAGVGSLTFALATRLRVAAFEGAPEAVAALAAAANAAVNPRIRALRRDLDRQPLLPKEAATYPVVVLDPPFAGAAEQVALLARARVPRIIHVSCNPAALARDAAPLAAAGYRVVSAVPVDQFLWSPHLESVTAFALGQTAD